MTESLSIRQDVTNSDHHSIRQSRTRYLPSTSGTGTGTLSYKRRILDRWTERLTASGLAGNNVVTEYLHGKYIKNLSFHTIDHAGSVILAFMHFLNKVGISILTLTRSNISVFVEYEQDRGLKAISIISQLTAVYAFINYLVRQDVIAPEMSKRFQGYFDSSSRTWKNSLGSMLGFLAITQLV